MMLLPQMIHFSFRDTTIRLRVDVVGRRGVVVPGELVQEVGSLTDGCTSAWLEWRRKT